MDDRARIPVTLPRANPTLSAWQDPPDAAVADLRSTPALPGDADVVIIGSGITGAAVAWHLLSSQDSSVSTAAAAAAAPPPPPPPPSIVMLEARQACSGATGRNGTPLPYFSSAIDID